MKKHIKNREEFLETQNVVYNDNELLFEEYATINKPSDGLGIFEVKVNGSGEGDNSPKEHDPPHFHLVKKDDRSFNIRILIPTIKQWKVNPVLTILEHTANTQNDWSGLRSIREKLIEWIPLRSKKLKTGSNLRFIIIEWNLLNESNPNTSEVFDDGEDFI